MEETLAFPVLLRLIDERSAAFRAAVTSASGLELNVPVHTYDAELVLAMYDRIPVDSLQLEGDRRLFDLLRDWE